LPQPPVPRSNRPTRKLPPLRPKKIIKLAVWCLVVGLVLAAFGIEPTEFWQWAGSVVTGIWNWLVEIFGKLGSYVVIGAAIVLPIWAARRLYFWLSR
jgi:hypothetical protein